MYQAVPHMYTYGISYRTYTCYNRLPEDGLSGSKLYKYASSWKLKLKKKTQIKLAKRIFSVYIILLQE